MQTMNHQVIIIGSGFGGQCAAISLRKQGITDFRILERRPFMGGTWRQNTYPGAAVDVQSPLYSFSFEPYKWSQMFADQDELCEYTEHIIQKYDLEKHTELNTNVEEVRWNEKEQHWEVHTNGDRVFRGQFLINASGPLSTPAFPNFKGMDKFKGESFHTNDWNHDFDYRGKRVAVIGSGASAAQVIPEIAPDVAHQHVFMRTPHWVLPRPDYHFNKVEQELLGLDPVYYALRRSIYWGLEWRVIGMKYSQALLKVAAQTRALALLRKQVKDPAKRKALTPDYTIGCKRVLLSSTLLPALCRDNTTLHTREDGVAEINAKGIKTTRGEQIDLDLIVYATGYDATDGAVSYPIIGKNGQSVGDFWHEFPRAYLGTAMPGFPNFFVVTGPNTGIGHTSAIFIIEAQMNYIMDSIKQTLKRRKNSIEVKAEAEDKYTTMIHKEMEGTVWEAGGCNSWYKSKSGKVIAMFPGFSFTFRQMARKIKPRDHVFA